MFGGGGFLWLWRLGRRRRRGDRHGGRRVRGVFLRSRSGDLDDYLALCFHGLEVVIVEESVVGSTSELFVHGGVVAFLRRRCNLFGGMYIQGKKRNRLEKCYRGKNDTRKGKRIANQCEGDGVAE